MPGTGHHLANGTPCIDVDFSRGECNQPPSDSIRDAGPVLYNNWPALHCAGEGYHYEIRRNSKGGVYGACILTNGTVCDVHEFMSHQCP